MEIIEKNFSGSEVTDLQRRLRLLDYDLGVTGIDGRYGHRTVEAVKKFQQDRGLSATGIVDQETWLELVDAGYKIGDRLLYLKNPPFRGDDVKTLQLWLKTLGFYSHNENGIFCQKTYKALLEFQDNMNIDDDGILGEHTLKHLKGLQRIIAEKKTSNFPYIKHRKNGLKDTASTIILDYDPLATPAEEQIKGNSRFIVEKAGICRGIIDSCRQFLSRSGFLVISSFDERMSSDISLFDRISNANKSSGDYLISVNLNYSADSGANGCSCYYFKGIKSYSIEGFQLANSIQNRLVKEMGIRDCRVHGANYAILKNTEMVSVLVEPAFISNEKQRKEVLDTGYQKKIGMQISKVLKTFLQDK